MKGLVLAVRYLTIISVGRGRPHEAGASLGGAAPWFPVVGLGIGLVVVATERLTGRLFPTLLSALLTVTVWKLLTGGLHLDGLADCLDGLAGLDPEHRLRIMRDGPIGAFGAIGLILFLLLAIAAVAELEEAFRWRALLVAPVIGRAMPVLLARLFRPARADGQGAAFQAGVRPLAVPIALGVGILVAVGVLGALGIVAVAVAGLVSVAWTRGLAARLGGVTGDVLGAAIEMAELATLLTVSAWTHAAR